MEPIATAAGVLTEGATEATKAVFASASQAAARALKGPAKSLAIKLLSSFEGYSDYLEETNARVSTFKVFSNPSQPVKLLDHFVDIEFDDGRNKKDVITQVDIIEKILKGGKVVISATAGHGKSMAMRYIALSLFENPKGKIPIFIELRHINRVSTANLLAFINSTYRKMSGVQVEALKSGLELGLFCLIFDGFDEVNHDI